MAAEGTLRARTRLARNVPLSFVYAFLMDFSMTAPIWVLYLRDERGFSMTEITFLEVPLFLLIVFAEVPTGAVADRYGRRVSLALASAILAVAMYVYGVADDYALILVSNLAWALAFTFRSGADTAMLYDSLSALGRAGDFQRTIGRLSALRSAAALGGLLLGAPIAAATSYSFAIVLTAVVGAVAMVVALFLHETPKHAVAEPAEASPSGGYLGTLGAGVREVFAKPALRALFVFSAVMAAAAAGPLQLLQQPWLAAHEVPTAKLGLLQAAAHGAAVVAALAAAGILARLGVRSAFAVLPLGLFLSCGLLGLVDHVFAGVAFLGIASMAGLQSPLLSDVVNRQIESGHRATALSVSQMFSNVLMATLWPLVGVSVDVVGLSPVFLAYGVGALVIGGWSLRVWVRTETASLQGAA
jgi:predicted MFS family arabinose efflux permease